MRITGIIGFVLMLLADVALFFTSMNMPAGSKTGGAFLIIALIELVIIIVYFIAALKLKHTLLLSSSILLLVTSIGSFFISGRWYNQDLQEYGKYLDSDMSFKMYVILVVVSVIFAILGIIFSLTDKNKKVVKIQG